MKLATVDDIQGLEEGALIAVPEGDKGELRFGVYLSYDEETATSNVILSGQAETEVLFNIQSAESIYLIDDLNFLAFVNHGIAESICTQTTRSIE